METDKLDFRAKRTLLKVDKHFKRLMHLVGFDSITIVMLMNHSKCSRTTFYGHFKDLDDLYTHYTKGFLDQFSYLLDETFLFCNPKLIQEKEKNKVIECLKNCLTDVRKESDFLVAMMDADKQQKFIKTIMYLIFESETTDPQSIIANQDKLTLPLNLVISFVVNMIISTLRWWLTQPNDMDEQILAETLFELIVNLPFGLDE